MEWAIKMNHAHLVSIITPTYNCESVIYETYLSIKSQTDSNWEWVVTDDCSSDNTLNILYEIEKEDSRVRVYVNKHNSGAAVTRNNSINKAKGQYIAFIDSDDLWEPQKLEHQLVYMKENNIAFCFTAYSLVNEKGRFLGKVVDSKQSSPLTYKDMLKKKATLGCSTVMLSVSDFEDINMPLIRTGQDYGLWLKLLKKGKTATPYPEVLTRYRIMPNSISRNKIKKAKRQWQIYRELENIPFLRSVYYFLFYAFRAVFRQ